MLISFPQNAEEVKVTTRIAERYHKQGMSFKMITPYDAQRNELESALKKSALKSGVPYEDTCFNVDSFRVSFTSFPQLLWHVS